MTRMTRTGVVYPCMRKAAGAAHLGFHGLNKTGDGGRPVLVQADNWLGACEAVLRCGLLV